MNYIETIENHWKMETNYKDTLAFKLLLRILKDNKINFYENFSIDALKRKNITTLYEILMLPYYVGVTNDKLNIIINDYINKYNKISNDIDNAYKQITTEIVEETYEGLPTVVKTKNVRSKLPSIRNQLLNMMRMENKEYYYMWNIITYIDNNSAFTPEVMEIMRRKLNKKICKYEIYKLMQ